MFIYNVKINGSRVFKIFLAIVIFVILSLITYICMHLLSSASNENSLSSLDSYISYDYISSISPSNYTNVLKTVHENLDDYVGTKFKFTGYVYRIFDLTDDQFILARNMIISSDFNYVVVGFLCQYEKATNLDDNCWVEITGEVTKGNYHGEMPIVKILSLDTTTAPSEENVYPPDDMYVLTSGVI